MTAVGFQLVKTTRTGKRLSRRKQYTTQRQYESLYTSQIRKQQDNYSFGEHTHLANLGESSTRRASRISSPSLHDSSRSSRTISCSQTQSSSKTPQAESARLTLNSSSERKTRTDQSRVKRQKAATPTRYLNTTRTALPSQTSSTCSLTTTNKQTSPTTTLAASSAENTAKNTEKSSYATRRNMLIDTLTVMDLKAGIATCNTKTCMPSTSTRATILTAR